MLVIVSNAGDKRKGYIQVFNLLISIPLDVNSTVALIDHMVTPVQISMLMKCCRIAIYLYLFSFFVVGVRVADQLLFFLVPNTQP